MLFTRYGVSGPLVLTASAYMSDPCSDYRMEIDWKPGLSAEELDRRILRDFSERQNRDFINALDALLPANAVPFVAGQSGTPGSLKVHQITKSSARRWFRR
jgi:predicted flavoprotein YhiN